MRPLQIMALLGWAAGLCETGLGAERSSTGVAKPSPPGPITFSGHIAKIIHKHCAGCHHEGQSAPFDLLTYRNFIIRVPLDRDRLVRAVEFAPGNPRVVHHAFIRVDEEGQARKLDGRDGVPGFTNMYAWARMPGGQFLTNNPANPHHPPRRVVYGESSNDEMCELGLQLLTHQPGGQEVLRQTESHHRNTLLEQSLRARVAANPGDATSLTRLGMTLWTLERRQEAFEHLQRAVRSGPGSAEAHHNLGVFLRIHGRPAEARQVLEAALRLDPRYPRTHQQLAFVFAALGNAREAERNFMKALELDPSDPVAQSGLAELRRYLRSRRQN